MENYTLWGCKESDMTEHNNNDLRTISPFAVTPTRTQQLEWGFLKDQSGSFLKFQAWTCNIQGILWMHTKNVYFWEKLFNFY